ncbi:hypothetical protein MtrunA17_Chr4g0051221 [Medicago truncatula]|uniref:Uncharacterized protein n=1 Tax=Medicago truncatula TaxID=3880 RepID=A0A396ID81_MEDTR|nr:hypothetical protein MtrunA17_Chr4g0051221 [Medicago truncatula]
MASGTNYSGLNFWYFKRYHNDKGFCSCVGCESKVLNRKPEYR